MNTVPLFHTCNNDCPDQYLDYTRMVMSSLEELRLALRLLVEPYHNRSAESCIVHLNQAWLYLYQLAIKLDGHCVMNYRNGVRENTYKDMKYNLILKESEEIKRQNRSSDRHLLSSSGTQRMILKRRRGEASVVGSEVIESFSSFVKIFDKFRLEEPISGGDLVPTPAYSNLALLTAIRNQIEHRAVMHFYSFTLLIMPYITANISNYFDSLDIAVSLLPEDSKESLNRFYPEASGSNFVTNARRETKLPLMFSLLDDYYTLEKYYGEEIKAVSNLEKNGESGITKCIEAYDREAGTWAASQDSYTEFAGQSYTQYKSVLYVKTLERSILQMPESEVTSVEGSATINNPVGLEWLSEFKYSAKDVAALVNKKFQGMKFKVRQDEIKFIAQHLKVRIDRPNQKDNSVDGESCIYIQALNRHLYSDMFIEKLMSLSADKIEQIVRNHRRNRASIGTK